MEALTRQRFDALMGSTRTQWTRIVGTELAWYSERTDRVLCVIVRDTTDADYACVILAKDRVGRYRAVHLSEWFATIAEAEEAVSALLIDWASRDDQEYEQGDEPRQQMDFFSPVHLPERLNPDFVRLIGNEELSPARAMVRALMSYFSDPDGNFVEQFQSTAFNPRIWELYLFAVLAEERCSIDRTYPAPDYLLSGIFGDAFIEAVTVNPNEQRGETGYPEEPGELADYLKNYLPIKFAGPLLRKLARQYWNEPHIGDRPLIFAIADYHWPNSMRRSQRSLCSYLYGYWFDESPSAASLLVQSQQRITEHVWGTKRVPSGFFNLPGTEHISAVISTGEDTMMKTNRMGHRAGFGSLRVAMEASGYRCVDHPSRVVPIHFSSDVLSPEYEELWIDGLQVYHNPRATNPLDIRMFADAAHHRFEDGHLTGIYVDGSPFAIDTYVSLKNAESIGQTH